MLPDGVLAGEDGLARCWWADSAPDYRAYHDSEWGFPVADDRRLFEKLSLEGFQAGLSWLTILRKREAFRRAFLGFDYDQVAAFGAADVARLLADAGIVRHRGKIEAVINNAQRAVELVAEEGSLARFVWSFEPDSRSAGVDRPGSSRSRPSPARWRASSSAAAGGSSARRRSTHSCRRWGWSTII